MADDRESPVILSPAIESPAPPYIPQVVRIACEPDLLRKLADKLEVAIARGHDGSYAVYSAGGQDHLIIAYNTLRIAQDRCGSGG